MELAVISNFQVDYMFNKPKWSSAAKSEKVTDAAKHFHFDGLIDEEDFAREIGWIRQGARAVVASAVREGNAEKVLNTLGIVLHAMQDLYTHTNVANVDWTPWVGTRVAIVEELPDDIWQSPVHALFSNLGSPENPYKKNWPTNAEERPHEWPRHRSGGMVCGANDDIVKCGVNHDTAARRHYLRSIEMATRATTWWAREFQRWVGDDVFWKKVTTFSAGFTSDCRVKMTACAKAAGSWGMTANTDKTKLVSWALSGEGCEWHWQDKRWADVILEMVKLADPKVAHSPNRPARDIARIDSFVGTFSVVVGSEHGEMTLERVPHGESVTGKLTIGKSEIVVFGIVDGDAIEFSKPGTPRTNQKVRGKAYLVGAPHKMFAGFLWWKQGDVPTGFFATRTK